METRKIISRENLPMRSPVLGTAVVWLVLDRLAASSVVIAVVFTIVAIYWIGWFAHLHFCNEIDILNGED